MVEVRDKQLDSASLPLTPDDPPRATAVAERLRIPLPLDQALRLTEAVRTVEMLLIGHVTLLQNQRLCSNVAGVLDEARQDRAVFETKFFKNQLIITWSDLRPIGPDMTEIIRAYQGLENDVRLYDEHLERGQDDVMPLSNPTQDPAMLESADRIFRAVGEMQKLIDKLADECRRLAMLEARAATESVIVIESMARRLRGSSGLAAPTAAPRMAPTGQVPQAQAASSASEKLADPGASLTSSSLQPGTGSEGGNDPWTGTPRPSSASGPLTN